MRFGQDSGSVTSLPAEIVELVDTFDFLDDWADKYRHLLDLAKTLPDLEESHKVDANKVLGCMSQVWLISDPSPKDNDKLFFRADSDAHIVRGLIAILLRLYSGRSAKEIVDTNAVEVFATLGLDEHLSVGRRNGLESMVNRIQSLARLRLPA